jgi:hypothetical protein
MLPQEHLVEQKNGQTASRIALVDHSERLSIEGVSVQNRVSGELSAYEFGRSGLPLTKSERLFRRDFIRSKDLFYVDRSLVVRNYSQFTACWRRLLPVIPTR